VHPLSADLITSLCPGWQIEVCERLDSTQDHLADQARAGTAAPKVVLAETQVKGRGRRGQAWHSGHGENLTFSTLLDPDLPLAQWPRLTTLCALSLCQTLRREFGLDVRIKWPNDLWIGQSKLCGLLAEVVAGPKAPRLILGVGINVNGLHFPSDLGQKATSLRLQLGGAACSPLDRNPLAAALLIDLGEGLKRNAESFAAALDEVRQLSLVLGKRIEVCLEGHTIHCNCLDINEEGHLILHFDDGTRRIISSAEQVRPIS
jgi:BirA family biotin operon repressor/biotin-[acetyl-CoA-carboxylase] ligase